MLFDPQLIVLGPAAYVITDTLGATGFMIYGVVYPFVIGTVCATAGYFVFRRGDLP
jgi:ABC-2 type transport system permease protein